MNNMNKVIKYIKSIFGKYDSEYEYWVKTKEIKIPTYTKKQELELRSGIIKWAIG